MNFAELFLLALGLSADACAAAAADGLCMRNINRRWTAAIGVCFGLFQGAMPTIGFLLGRSFADYIRSVDHVIALMLLGFLGGKMLVDAMRTPADSCVTSAQMTVGLLLTQGFATSVDALAAGISLAALDVKITYAAAFICAVTALLSVLAVCIGRRSGGKLGKKAQIAGGLILIGIGVKIFLEHTVFS
ncbi:MAG: manganese efflux pump MntP family protein [Oscillospiraceae bacterium]